MSWQYHKTIDRNQFSSILPTPSFNIPDYGIDINKAKQKVQDHLFIAVKVCRVFHWKLPYSGKRELPDILLIRCEFRTTVALQITMQ